MQIANSFDAKTVEKILKGLLYAALGGAGLEVLNFIGTIHISNPVVAVAVATLLPAVTHAFVQWKAGVDPSTLPPDSQPQA